MTDRFTVRAVVLLLGAFALIGLGGLIWLIGGAKNATDATLLAVVAGPTGTALGALGTLLARTSVGDDAPLPVAGPGGGPVPVNDVGPD